VIDGPQINDDDDDDDCVLKVKQGTSESVKCKQRIWCSNLHSSFNYKVVQI
jgi:hypothetical protein